MKNDGTTNMTSGFDLVNAFGRLYIYANYTSSSVHTVRTKFIKDSSGSVDSNLVTDIFASNKDKWYKVVVSVKSNLASTYTMDTYYIT